MALNKKFVKMHKDKRAEMGVGTMIIFIAMVLVAAVAASVLISTANTVREQATQTGNDAISEVASGFNIKYVKGTVTENAITQMDIYVQLSAGSPALRMGDVILSITAGGKSGELVFSGPGEVTDAAETGDEPDKYDAAVIPEDKRTDAPFAKYGTISQGNLTKVTVKFIDNAALSIAPGDSVLIKIMPAKGAPTTISFTVPPVLNKGSVDLR